MDLIEQLKAQAFAEYLQKYGNTICGRHPIGVLLNVSLSFYFYKSLLSAISQSPWNPLVQEGHFHSLLSMSKLSLVYFQQF